MPDPATAGSILPPGLVDVVDETLEESVRRFDPDRWLSSRFVTDPGARADLTTLYAFDHELSRAGAVASNPLIAEIRLTWWREVLLEMLAGEPVRTHPLAQRLIDVVRRRHLDREALEAMIDARIETLEIDRFEPEQAVAWAHAAPGSAAVLAAQILAPSSPEAVARAAGAVWGLSNLIASGAACREDLIGDIRLGLEIVNAARASFPVPAFPAIAHATLARSSRPSPLEKRARLFAAVFLGRV